MKAIFYVFVIILVFGQIARCAGYGGEEGSSKDTKDDRRSREEAIVMAGYEEDVKRILKDPESATFSGVSLYRSGGATVVCGYVSSRNSFGGFSGSQRFISNGIGFSVLEEQAEDMDEVWGRFCN